MRRTTTIIAVLVAALIAGSCGGGSDVTTQSAVAIIDSDLLGDGNYTGSGSYTVIEAQRAYSTQAGATAVAARVSVPGEDSLCLFWYVGGHNPGEGLIIGDNVTRYYSVWSAAASVGSPANDTVKALKATPEGKAVIAASGC